MIKPDAVHEIKSLLCKKETYLGSFQDINMNGIFFTCRLHLEFKKDFAELHIAYTPTEIKDKTLFPGGVSDLTPDDVLFTAIFRKFKELIGYNGYLGYACSETVFKDKVVFEFRGPGVLRFLKKVCRKLPSVR